MSTVHIMIPSREAVQDFVTRASGLNFDLDLADGSRVVDAKSLLGIIYLGFGRILNLSMNSEHVQEAKEALSAYLV